LAWIAVIGGIAVLASYAYGLVLDPEAGAGLWGGVPQSLVPLYTTCMILAAAGFFPFTHYLFFRLDPDEVRIAGRFGYGLFLVLYLLILIPSAAWLPLTAALLRQGGDGWWLLIRLVLALVAIGSGGVLAALLSLRPRPGGWAYWLAVIGCVPFCIQTVVLDLLVWTAFFPA
jgi:hypothetical protein